MDFMQRIAPNQQQQRSAPLEQMDMPRAEKVRRKEKRDILAWGGVVGSNALLFIVALLVAALAWYIFSSAPTSQAKYIDSTKLQAVFLNTGQVYFGNITSLNKDFLALTNVYYLQSSNSSSSSSSSSSNQNISLVKLGCELHEPYDLMVVNTTQVTFWENLKADGQVAKAVATFQKENPNGQTCSNTANASTNSSSSLQNSTNTTTNKQ